MTLPATLRPGETLEIGEARISRGPDGSVEACDPHGCEYVEAPADASVRLLPAPAAGRLLSVSYIYVEFERKVYARPGNTIWFYAPVEVEVIVGGVPAARLSPVRVKYTLVGDVVDGVLCRYYRSPTRLGEPPGSPPPGLALAAAVTSGDPGILPGMGVSGLASRLYVGSDGALYYSLHSIEIDGALATVKPGSRPPVEGLKEVRRPPRRRALLQQAVQQLVINTVWG